MKIFSKMSKKESSKKNIIKHAPKVCETWRDSFHVSVSPYIIDLKRDKKDYHPASSFSLPTKKKIHADFHLPKLDLSKSFRNRQIKLVDTLALFSFLKFIFTPIIYCFCILDRSIRVSNIFDQSQRISKIYLAQRTIVGSLMIFVLVCILIVSPIKAASYYEHVKKTKWYLEDSTKQALGMAADATLAFWNNDFEKANLEFSQAKNTFKELQLSFHAEENMLTSILERAGLGQGKSIRVAKETLLVGERFSALGEVLVSYFSVRSTDPEKTRNLVAQLLDSLEKIVADLDEVRDNFLPKDMAYLNQTVTLIKNNFDELRSISEIATKFITDNQERRYLVFFQNSNEIRPTGGFLGSFAKVVLQGAKIQSIEIPSGGTYDLQGQLREMLISPEPLHYINPRWECQDSNWYFDFPTSAKRMAKCYESARGESVDGVITLNDSLLSDLLGITGPIQLPEYGLLLDQENVINTIQYITEVGYKEKDQAPKQIIADLRLALEQRISEFSSQQKASLISLILLGLNQGNIQIYVKDSQTQKAILALGWSGQIKYTTGDYLAVVHTNIGGGKTDMVIKEHIEHNSTIDSDGLIIDEVRITREHLGKEGDLFTGGKNRDFMRLYVPFGSIFLNAEGFDVPDPFYLETPEASLEYDKELAKIEGHKWIDPKSKMTINDEFGKTVFSNWIILEPGQSKTVIIRYQLPQKLILYRGDQNIFDLLFSKNTPQVGKYTLYLQKQSGSKNQTIDKSIIYSKNLHSAVYYPQRLQKNVPGIIKFDTIDFTNDQFLFTVLLAP